MFTKEDRSTFPYWFAHWCAYNMTALNLKCWKFKYLFHDIEKPFLKLFLPYKKVQTFHREHNKHHPEWLEHKLEECIKYYELETVYQWLLQYDYEATIIDWECGRFTKVAQPRNAQGEFNRVFEMEHFSKKYPLITRYCYKEFRELMEAWLIKLDLNKDEKESTISNTKLESGTL